MSHLRQRRASLTRVKGRVLKIPSDRHVARRVMTRRGDARLVFQIELGSILRDAR